MFTICPSCSRQFRITARQLSAVKGLVQCGFCGKQFNALERLHDQPQPILKAPVSVELDGQQEPRFDLGDQADDTQVSPLKTRVPNHVLRENTAQQIEPADELINTLLDDDTVRKSGMARVLWSFGVLLLILIMVLQFAWFNRDEILSRYPQYLPVAKQLCERLRCEVIRDQAVASIVVLNRDVRDHPGFYNVLLVNVTIENQSTQVVPYPVILLSLYDTNGRKSGYRQFSPREYLGENTIVEHGMRPSEPTHLVLEVTGSTETAVGFEIGFL